MHSSNTLTEVEDPAARSRGEKNALEEKREGTQESQQLVPWVEGVGDCRHRHEGACGEPKTTLRLCSDIHVALKLLSV